MRSQSRRWVSALGGLQGFALWLLYEAWPLERRAAALFVALCSFVVVHGLVLHFARTGQHVRRLGALAAATGAVFAAISLWVGWQLPEPGAQFAGDQTRLISWGITAAIALYALGPFLQIHQETGRLRFPYVDLYRHSWNNFFVLIFGAAYALALWLVLLLWQALFQLVGIATFQKIFMDAAFAYPVTGAAVGYGLAAGRESEATIATLRSLTQSLFRTLLPVVSAVTLGFAASLPFTGLDLLYETGSAASILSGWLAAFILLVNAVYLDGSALPPYRPALRRLVELGTLVLPALAVIAFRAVQLRVGQYGVTPDRIFASIGVVVLGLYAGGYALAVIRRGEPWLPRIRQVNFAMAIVLIAIAFVLHTPLGDPLAWSARSQVERLRSGKVSAAEFDFGALRFHLGHRGEAALRELEAEPPPDEAALVRERIRLARTAGDYWNWKRGLEEPFDVDRSFAWRPLGSPWPPGLRESLERLAMSDYRLRECKEREGRNCWTFSADLDGDGQAEALVSSDKHGYVQLIALARGDGDEWRVVGILRSNKGNYSFWELSALLEDLESGRFERVLRVYPDLEIGGEVYRLYLD